MTTTDNAARTRLHRAPGVWVAVLAIFYFTGTDVGPGMPIHLSK